MDERTEVSASVRTQDEIAARIRAYDEPASDDALFGFRREVLVDALDFDHAKPWLKDDATAEEWESVRPADIATAAREYLAFAVGKILDHRGISASRSVDKLREYAWLLGRDDVVSAMDSRRYTQYGAPKVKAFADGMGFEWPASPELDRMAQGLPCTDDCESGCGS